MSLDAPLPGETVSMDPAELTAGTVEAEGDAFMAAFGAFQAGG